MSAPTEHHRPPPPKWVLGIFIACIVGLQILGFFVAGAWPKLLKDHPLLLICLTNRYRFLLATANDIPAVPQIVIGVLRNLASDPVYYLLGWYYGDAAIDWFRRSMGSASQVIDATERWFHKLAIVVVFITPSPFVCALAGATGMKARKFWPANIAGTIVVVVTVRLLSDVLEKPMASFLRFNERNSRWLMIASIAFVVFLIANAGMGGKKATSLRDLDREARGEPVVDEPGAE